MDGRAGRHLGLWAMALSVGGCAESEFTQPVITQVEVRPSGSDNATLSIPPNVSSNLDIFVEPGFSLDFDPNFGSSERLTPGARPAWGQLRPESGAPDVELTRVALRNPRQVTADAPPLKPGRYIVAVDDGRGGELTYANPVLVREPERFGDELYVANVPDTLRADDCATIEVGFVPEGATGPFLPPPPSPTDNEVLVEIVDFADGFDGTVDGLAVTAPERCGLSTIREPSARVSAQRPTARWNLRGRRPGSAAFGVRATRVRSGDFVDALPAGDRALRVVGEVAVEPEIDVALPGACRAVRWRWRRPSVRDSARDDLKLTLGVETADGRPIEGAVFQDRSCTSPSASVELGREASFATQWIRLEELGAYALSGRVTEPELAEFYDVTGASFRVVEELELGDARVGAPPVVALGVPFPAVVEGPEGTSCRLELTAANGEALAPSQTVTVDDGVELAWLTPTRELEPGRTVRADLACIESGRRPRESEVEVGRCSGLALDASALRLRLSNRAPTRAAPSTIVSLTGASAASSVFYTLGERSEPARFRLDAGASAGGFRWDVPLSGDLETITAVVRDEFGCPAVVEEALFPGADPDRVVSIEPGSLADQLATIDPSDESPLVLRFADRTVIETVVVDADLARIESELVLLGPGAGALLRLQGDVELADRFVLSWIDLHGSGRVLARGPLIVRDGFVRQGVQIEAVSSSEVAIGPGVVFRGIRRPMLRMENGSVKRSLFTGAGAVTAEGPFVEVEDGADFAQVAMTDSDSPLVAAAFDEPIEVALEFATFHRAAPVDPTSLASESSVRIVGSILSRTPEWARELAKDPIAIESSVIVGYEDEPEACDAADVECEPSDIFPDSPVAPERLSYQWCDAVDGAVSDRDKTGLGVFASGIGARFFGFGYDYGHLEYVQSTPGDCP